jgi:PelA/Pel-15E family pectate lyase
MKPQRLPWLVLRVPFLWTVCGIAPFASAAVIGTNPPVQSVTLARIATLPVAQQPAWTTYLAKSDRVLHFEQDFLQKELRDHKLTEPVIPPSGRSASSLPLDKPADWYSTSNALRIADIVVSFQTPSGGWSKNLDLSQHPRAPGEAFAADNRSRILGDADFDLPHNTNWNYVGTFDNDATVTEMRYLAKVITAVGTNASQAYRRSFLHGIVYISAAQYPNGGWPQVWPLEGGYHDMITYNDNAVINILNLLLDVAKASNDFAFVTLSARNLAGGCVNHGVECLLATQINTGGHRTVWCQQHDPITLQPASGRNYEMPAEVSSESADILLFLMSLPKSNPPLVAAVQAAAAWFEKTKITDMAWQRNDAGERQLVHTPGAGPIWARFYEIGTDRPIFGDRDKTIHDSLDEISQERRRGYAWYRDSPKRALEVYADWSKTHTNTLAGAGAKIVPQVVTPIAGPSFRVP